MRVSLIAIIGLLCFEGPSPAQSPRMVSPLTNADLDYYFEPVQKDLIFVRKAGSPPMFYISGSLPKVISEPGTVLQITPKTPFRLNDKHSEITFLPLVPGEITSKGIRSRLLVLVERRMANNSVHAAVLVFNRSQPSQPDGALFLFWRPHTEEELVKLEAQAMTFPEER